MDMPPHCMPWHRVIVGDLAIFSGASKIVIYKRFKLRNRIHKINDQGVSMEKRIDYRIWAKRLVQEFIQRLCIGRSRTCLRFVGYLTEAGMRVVFGTAVHVWTIGYRTTGLCHVGPCGGRIGYWRVPFEDNIYRLLPVTGFVCHHGLPETPPATQVSSTRR